MFPTRVGRGERTVDSYHANVPILHSDRKPLGDPGSALHQTIEEHADRDADLLLLKYATIFILGVVFVIDPVKCRSSFPALEIIVTARSDVCIHVVVLEVDILPSAEIAIDQIADEVVDILSSSSLVDCD